MSQRVERWCSEWRWAWLNLRARRWRAGLAIGLLAVALGANAIVFSAADSIVFHRSPFADAERLVEIHQRDPRTGRTGDSFMSAALFDEWRRQTDLFTSVHGSLSKNLFLSSQGVPEKVAIADITVGLIEMLGARPRWGRTLVDGDDRQMDLQPVLVSELLARQRFGDPASAIGRRLETTGDPLIVVGVMAASFRFPDGSARIWRALDPRGPLTRNFVGVSSIARIARGVSPDLLARMMDQRSADVGRAAGRPDAYAAEPMPLRGAAPEQRRLFLILLGAAGCLLLIACANVAGLELANAVQRAGTYAIQLSLGASRAGLARIAFLEGAALLGAALCCGIALAQLGSAALVNYLPLYLARGSANPIDIDQRALFFMAAATTVVWLLSSLPAVFYATTGNLINLLKLEGYAVAASGRSSFVRRALTIAEVALAVMLLVGSVAYVRSYLSLLALEKGFDSAGVVTINLSIPPQVYPSMAEKRALAREAVDRLLSRPGVIAAANASPPPAVGASYFVSKLQLDDRPLIEEEITISELDVEPQYFPVLGIPLREGRFFAPGEPATSAIVSETFAGRYWPNQPAVGHSYRRDPRVPWLQIVGVVGHVRTRYDPPGSRSASAFQTYVARQPPPPQVANTPRSLNTGGSFGFLDLMVRVDARTRAADLYQTVRAIDNRFILKLDFVDDEYARQFDDRLLATRIIGGFGLLAFVIAAAGIYGTMALLVAYRAREIGIRMALGADARRISRLVLGSALGLVAVGAVLGIAGAIAASRWVQSQLFGVRATDPGIIVAVTIGVAAAALLATWQPARHAARIDPKALLRN